MADPTFAMIPIERVLPNPEQPRLEIDPSDLKGLAATIRLHGVIEPIAVEKHGQDYILHNGERRWRAAKMAGLKLMPAMVSPALNGDAAQKRLERALVANIQQEPMSPVDDALALRRLKVQFDLSNREISKRTGKAESWIVSRIHLSYLDAPIQQLIRDKRMSAEPKVVAALNKILDPKERIAFALKCAEKKTTGNGVVSAVKKYLELKTDIPDKESTSAIRLMQDIERSNKPEWDALYQLGRVPPWPIVNNAVMHTCDNCSLRPNASEKVCGSCALPEMLKSIMDTIHEAQT